MKSNSGITLTSLIIYVIGMTIVVGTIATLTSFFFKNIDIKSINDNGTTQYTKFSSLFLEETNKMNNRVIDCKTTEEDGKKVSYIVFSTGNQFTFKQENNSIYKNKVKVCDNVEDCDFSYTFVNSMYNIKVNFKNKNIDLTDINAMTYFIK